VNNEWAFLPMRSSNDLLGDDRALRERMAEDSYLYFEQILPVRPLRRIRHDIASVLARHGMIRGGDDLMRAVSVSEPVREGDDEYFAVHDEIQRLESFHSFAHDAALRTLMASVLGASAFPHPLKVVRLGFPGHHEVSTPPHQDYPNNQGTPDLTATWIPLGAIPMQLGGLAVLRGSAAAGVLPLARHLGPGNRQCVVPPDLLEELRWVSTDFALGDVLLFPSTTVHASLHNASEFNMRLSIDFRWQLEGAALTPVVLEPHFGRLTWPEVYADWESEEFQYYWCDLDYAVVPFEEFPIVDAGDDDYHEAMKEALRYERKRRHRHERKLERLAAGDEE
jgi:hypothetical protein